MRHEIREKVIHAACRALKQQTAEAHVSAVLTDAHSILEEYEGIRAAKSTATNEYVAQIASLEARLAGLRTVCPHWSQSAALGASGTNVVRCDLCGETLSKVPN